MQSELVEGLTMLGFREYLATCPSCSLSGTVMTKTPETDNKPCPRCGTQVQLIEAPRPEVHKSKLSGRVAIVSTLLLLVANAIVVTNSFHNTAASEAVFAFQAAWFLMTAAWVLKR